MKHDFLIIDYMMFVAPPLVTRLSLDGYRVVYSPVLGQDLDSYISSTICQGLENVIVDINWYNYLDSCRYIIVCDNEHGGGIVDYLKNKGYKVYGTGSKEAELELNRHKGQLVASRYGLDIPDTKEFDNYDKVLKFLESNEGEYVIKFDKFRRFAETYVSKDTYGRDIQELLENLKYNIRGVIPNMYLQNKVSGIEFCIGGYFNGHRFVEPLLVNFDGDNGFVILYNFKNKKLEAILKVFEPYFEKTGYIGYVDINLMLTENKLYFLEWTIRFGGGVSEILFQSVEDLGEFFMNLIDGEDKPINLIPEITDDKQFNLGIAVRVGKDNSNTMKEIITPEVGKLPIYRNCSLWISYPYMDEEGRLYVLPNQADKDKTIGFITSLGDDLDSAIETADSLYGSMTILGSDFNIGSFEDEMNDRIKSIVNLEDSMWKGDVD